MIIVLINCKYNCIIIFEIIVWYYYDIELELFNVYSYDNYLY